MSATFLYETDGVLWIVSKACLLNVTRTCLSPIVPVKHTVALFMNISHISTTTMSMSHWLPAHRCGNVPSLPLRCCHGDVAMETLPWWHHLRVGLEYFYDDRGASTECVLRLPTDGPLHHHTWWHTQELRYNDTDIRKKILTNHEHNITYLTQLIVTR